MGLRAKIAAIEFAGDEVRLAVIKMRGRRPKVLELHMSRAEYSDPEQRTDAFVRAVEAVTKRVKNSPTAYVLCISSFYSVFRMITIPFRGRRKVAAAVKFELEPYLAFPIEDLVVDFSVIQEIQGQTDVLAAGVRRAVLEEQLGILKAAGIDPEGIDIDAVGLTGLWKAFRPATKGLHAVLHVREEGAILAVLNNKILAYFRHLSFTAGQMRANPASAAREIQNSLRAFHAAWRAEGEIAALTITGTELPPEERERFERELDIPVTEENLLAKLKCAALAEAAMAEIASSAESALPETDPIDRCNCWEAAVGVAMGAARAGYSMNFRKGDLAWKSGSRLMAPHLMLASCLALVLLVGVVWYYRDARKRCIAEIADLESETKSIEQQVQALQSQGVNVPIETFSDPSLLDILVEISAKMPDDKVSITDLRVDHAAGQAPWITIRGVVKDDAIFGAAFADLAQSGMFKVDSEPELKLDEGKSTFKIVARRPETPYGKT